MKNLFGQTYGLTHQARTSQAPHDPTPKETDNGPVYELLPDQKYEIGVVAKVRRLANWIKALSGGRRTPPGVASGRGFHL
jgi:hypothetical protein